MRQKHIEDYIAELATLKLPDLQARYAEVIGVETKAPNKTYLIKQIVEALEKQPESGADSEPQEREEGPEVDEHEDVAAQPEDSDDEIGVGEGDLREETPATKQFKVLPVRMETEIVEQLDEAWRRHGLKSRMDLFRKALADYMASLGEEELAHIMLGG